MSDASVRVYDGNDYLLSAMYISNQPIDCSGCHIVLVPKADYDMQVQVHRRINDVSGEIVAKIDIAHEIPGEDNRDD